MAHLMYVGWIGAIPLCVSYGVAILGTLQGIPIFCNDAAGVLRDVPDLC